MPFSGQHVALCPFLCCHEVQEEEGLGGQVGTTRLSVLLLAEKLSRESCAAGTAIRENVLCVCLSPDVFLAAAGPEELGLAVLITDHTGGRTAVSEEALCDPSPSVDCVSGNPLVWTRGQASGHPGKDRGPNRLAQEGQTSTVMSAYTLVITLLVSLLPVHETVTPGTPTCRQLQVRGDPARRQLSHTVFYLENDEGKHVKCC